MSIKIRMAATILLTVAAVVSDWKSYKIKNEIIIVGMITGGILFLYEILVRGDGGIYIAGACSVLVGMFMVFLVRGIGAGDVKLLTVAGLLTGMEVIWNIIALTFIAALLIGGLSVIKGGRKVELKLSDSKSFNMHAFHFSFAILAGEVLWGAVNLGKMVY